MNRRTFTASLAGLLGVVGIAGKAKAAPKITEKLTRATTISGNSGTVVSWGRPPIQVTSWSGTFTGVLEPLPNDRSDTAHSPRTTSRPVSSPPAPEAGS